MEQVMQSRIPGHSAPGNGSEGLPVSLVMVPLAGTRPRSFACDLHAICMCPQKWVFLSPPRAGDVPTPSNQLPRGTQRQEKGGDTGPYGSPKSGTQRLMDLPNLGHWVPRLPEIWQHVAP